MAKKEKIKQFTRSEIKKPSFSLLNHYNKLVNRINRNSNLQINGSVRQIHNSRGSFYYVKGEGGAGAVSFAEVTVTLTHAAEDEYTVQKINSSGTKDEVNITINRALGYEAFGSDATDIRYFSPWYGVGAIIPIAQHYDSDASALKWFINLALIFVGKPADRSIEVEEVTTSNESEYRTMAVYK